MFFDEMIEEYGYNFDKWDRYVWPTEEKPYIKEKEAWRVYEDDMDDLDDQYDWNVDGIERLQEALNEFVEENKRNTAYYPDYSTALLLDDEYANRIGDSNKAQAKAAEGCPCYPGKENKED